MGVVPDVWPDDEYSEIARRLYEEMKASGVLDQMWLAQQAIIDTGILDQVSLAVSSVAALPPIDTESFRAVVQTLASVSVHQKEQFAFVLESVARSTDAVRQMLALTSGASLTLHATSAEVLASLIGVHETLAGVGASFFITAGEESSREIAFQRQIELTTVEVAEADSTLTEESAAEILRDVLSAPRLTEESSVFVEGQVNWRVQRGSIVIESTHQFSISSTDEKDAPKINQIVNSFVRLTSDGGDHPPIVSGGTSSEPYSILSDPRSPVLVKFLLKHFNLPELQELCFNNKIPYEGISGDTIAVKTQEAVSYYCRHHGDLDDLITWCKKARPNAPWPFEE